MKTPMIQTLTSLVCMIAAVGLVANVYIQPRAQDIGTARGGAAKLNAPPVVAKAAPAHRGMTCTKCEDVMATKKDTDSRGAGSKALTGKTQVKQGQHQCPTCKTDWTVTGQGRAKAATPSHKCGSCEK